jgi:hypothetical protein
MWLECEKEIEAFKTKISPENWVELRYETLMEDFDAEINRICQFMGTKFDPRMLEYIQNSNYDNPNPKLAYQWQRKMLKKDLSLVEGRIGDMLVARGYELSGHPPIFPRRWEATKIRLQSRLHTNLHRIKCYGIYLYLIEIIARRLGMKQFKTKCQHKINAIDETFIR